MRANSSRPTTRAGRRRGASMAAVAAALVLSGCGPDDPSAGSPPVPSNASASGTAGTSAGSNSQSSAATSEGAKSPGSASTTVSGRPQTGDDGGPAAAADPVRRQGSDTHSSPSAAGVPAPTALPPYGGLSGPLAGLNCRAQVAAVQGATVALYETQGATIALREKQGALGFRPLLLARGGEVGDVGGGMASYVALDAGGQLHYVEITLARDASGRPAGATVSLDRVVAQGYAGARALGASVAFHGGGDPEVFVVDAEGRLLRHTLSAVARQLTLTPPTVVATGLTAVTGMSVETFDVDGDLAQERDAATRVLLIDGDKIRQTLVRRDGGFDPLLTVLGPRAELTGSTTVTRAFCLRPGGSMSDTGAMVVFGGDGLARVFGGTYTPAVAAPRLEPAGSFADALGGLLAG